MHMEQVQDCEQLSGHDKPILNLFHEKKHSQNSLIHFEPFAREKKEIKQKPYAYISTIADLYRVLARLLIVGSNLISGPCCENFSHS